MKPPVGNRIAIVAAVAALALSACSAGSTAPPAPASSTPPSSAVHSSAPGESAASPTPQEAASPQLPAFRLVLMGDSMFNGVQGAAIPVIAGKLRVSVSVQPWINPDLSKYAMGGERSADLVARLRTDATLRADIESADAIWFDVPLGTFIDACGIPTPSTTRAEIEACLPGAADQVSKDADAMIREIVALRSPTQASIRALTVWQYFGSTFRAGGTIDVAAAGWRDVRQAVMRAAERHGVGTVDGYAAFSGDDGSRDAVAAGDLLSDEVHLTDQGVRRLVDLFVASGLTP